MKSRFIYAFASVALVILAGRTCPAQRPELVIQTGHSSFVKSVAYSPDGKTLASGSWDYSIILWDALTGGELRSFRGHTGQITSIAFSPDGKTLASGSFDMTVKIWDIATGAELQTFKGHLYFIESVNFSTDGKMLATGSADHTIKLWDISNGTVLRTLAQHTSGVSSVAFSPDGKTIASGSWDKSVKLWDVATSTELRTLTGHTDPISSVAFSPDGKTLASGSWDNTAKTWDVVTGTELRSFSGHTGPIDSVAFSPDGKVLATGSKDNSIKLWEVDSGNEISTLNGHTSFVETVVFSPDGKSIATGSSDDTVKLWSIATGTVLRTFKGRADFVKAVAFSPDGTTIASDGGNGTIRLWDLASGSSLRVLKGHSGFVFTLAFSRDGKLLASGSWDNTVKLWDVRTGTELRTFVGHSNLVTSVTFSPDGKFVASSSMDKTIRLWSATTGSESGSVKGEFGIASSIAFSPDGKTIASGSLDSRVMLWDVSTGLEIRNFRGHTLEVTSVIFSSDGKTLVSSSADGTVRLWAIANGAEQRTISGIAGGVSSTALSADGKTLATGSGNLTLKLWDISTGMELPARFVPERRISSIAFAPDGKYLISGGDGIAVWDVSGKELATMTSFDQLEWLVATPEGLFDGSPAAWATLFWRFDNDTFNRAPVEAFFGDFYYPDLLADIFAGRNPKPPKEISQKDRRSPQLAIVQNDPRVTIDSKARTVSLNVAISHALAGAQDVRLFRNGSLVNLWPGDVLKGKDNVVLDATIPIVAGENKLTAYAFNRDNIKSGDAELTITGADSLKRAGTLYVVAVGVGNYANPEFSLKYTPPDATDFGDEMRREQELLQNQKLGRYAQVKVVSLLNEQATKANITLALARLAGAQSGTLPDGAPAILADLQQSQPEDGVIVYFSGHGTAQGDRFYLIPHDIGYMGPRKDVVGAGLQTILTHSISDLELEEAFRGIDAGEMLLVIDACNSGQALQSDDWRRGPMNTKGLAQLAYEKGMYVLTASQSVELAYESEALKHSYMTYALIEEGLKTKAKDADTNHDGQVWLREWFDYAVQRVPHMREAKIEQAAKTKGKSLEEVDLTERPKLQTPRVFYRREPDAQPWVVARIP